MKIFSSLNITRGMLKFFFFPNYSLFSIAFMTALVFIVFFLLQSLSCSRVNHSVRREWLTYQASRDMKKGSSKRRQQSTAFSTIRGLPEREQEEEIVKNSSKTSKVLRRW